MHKMRSLPMPIHNQNFPIRLHNGVRSATFKGHGLVRYISPRYNIDTQRYVNSSWVVITFNTTKKNNLATIHPYRIIYRTHG